MKNLIWLRNKATYQWQVLGWSGCIAMTWLFAGIIASIFDAYICAQVALKFGDHWAALLAVLCAVAALVFLWAGNWLFREYEKHS